jgi:hypothetical protein
VVCAPVLRRTAPVSVGQVVAGRLLPVHEEAYEDLKQSNPGSTFLNSQSGMGPGSRSPSITLARTQGQLLPEVPPVSPGSAFPEFLGTDSPGSTFGARDASLPWDRKEHTAASTGSSQQRSMHSSMHGSAW